jgi:leucyl-tRNA synthetase
VCGLAGHITDTETKEVTSLLHKTIKKVSTDIEEFKFNTAISTMMIYVNGAEKEGLTTGSYKSFLQILAPFAPHLTEELWNLHVEKDTIHLSSWPIFDESLVKDDTVTIGVQINGKARGEITVAPDDSEEIAMECVKNNHTIQSKIEGMTIKKIIYVPGRILNIIVV